VNYVIYHDKCYDGFTAAWVAKQALNGAAFVPASYGQEPLRLFRTKVYLLDFSYPKDVMLDLAMNNEVVVLDHHKTAQANFEGLEHPNLTAIFDMERSGAGLAWDYFFPPRLTPGAPEGSPTRPRLVNYIEDRDLWRFALPESRAVHAYIESHKRTFDIWDDLHLCFEDEHHFKNVVIPAGASILRFQQQKVEEISAEVQWRDIGGYRVPVVNCPYAYGSLCGEYLLAQYPEAPFAGYYLDRGDGERQWGLRSTSTRVDVSEVARLLGGGGHRNASGFVEGKTSR
jgi:oligoribonuclease NrnB/cAMP/cGMP phosphodiesterase (DHH superfamily)